MKLTDIAPYDSMGDPIKHVYLEYVGPNDSNVSKKSNKFWEGAVFERDNQFVFVYRFGAYGKRGRVEEKVFPSRYAAKRAWRTKRDEKRDKKGYTKEIDVVTRLSTLIEDE